MSWISLQAKTDKTDLKAVRVLIIVCFASSVAVTAAHAILKYLGAPMHLLHALHIIHVILISCTFLLLSGFLYVSALIASKRNYRDMKLRSTVDESAAFIHAVPEKDAIFNACAGVLAKKGIFTGSPEALKELAFVQELAVDGDAPEREGRPATEKALTEIGVTLKTDAADNSLRLALGSYAEHRNSDLVFTEDKITHTLYAVFVSRLYAKYRAAVRLLLILAVLAAAAALVFGKYTYVFAAFALWAGAQVLFVYHIEKRSAKPTFAKVTSIGPLPKRLKIII